jgi:hypothetical protein
MDIKQALAALDPENDEHWTKAGLPSVEHLAKALEVSPGALTRKAIEEAQPGFSRENPVVEPDGEDDDFLAEGTVTQTDGSEPTTDTVKVAEDFLSDDEDPREGDGVDTLRRELAKAVSRVDAIKQALDEGRRELARAEDEVRRVEGEIAKVDPPLSFAEAHKRYVAQQIANRQARHGVVTTLNHVKSPLDQAMAPKRGRGRPDFQPKA